MASTIATSANLGGIGNRTLKAFTGNLGTYTTNGIDITPAQLGMSRVDFLMIAPAGGIVFERVGATAAILARWNGDATPAALPEVANATDISTIVFNGLAIGLP